MITGGRLAPAIPVLEMDYLPVHGRLAPIYFTQLRLDGGRDTVPAMEPIASGQSTRRWELLKAFCALWGVRVRYHPQARRFDVQYKTDLIDIATQKTQAATIRRLYLSAKMVVKIYHDKVAAAERRLGPDGLAAVDRLRGQ